MIKEQKQKHDWELIFLGANIDFVETARRFGIGADRAVDWIEFSWTWHSITIVVA